MNSENKAAQRGLQKYGELIIEYVYDEFLRDIRDLRNGTKKWGIGSEYTQVMNKLSEADKDKISDLVEQLASTAIFSFLQIFEDHEEFKLVYSDRGKEHNLAEASEMLKSEHHGDTGWIARFSKERKAK